MGVPSFFKWLARKYPKILVNAIETYPETDVDGNLINPDTSLPNPNEVEYDCLYLDMNGIIHPCTHPENRPPPTTEDEMMLEIFLYIDRLFNIVRPRRLVYFAIDGVAPRAKMNQQRSRRFKSAKETRDNKHITEQLVSDLRDRGLYQDDQQPVQSDDHDAKWDRNQITPGTPFMAKVADALRYYILGKITNDPGWKNVSCILSDSNVPGEGEHKLMEYIRYQHSQEGYNANTRHCICGLDADLIMLGLATHEPHFSILREDVLIDKKPLVHPNASRGDMYKHDPFQFLCLNVMREYLELELKPRERTSFEFDLERAIDDYVFLCFLVGNDFLPHIPTLEIRDDAITKLIKSYRELLPQLDGYLTENGRVHFDRVQKIFKTISTQEDEILAKKRERNLFSRQRSMSQSNNIRGSIGLSNEMRSQDDFIINYHPNASFKDHMKVKRKQLDDQRLARFKEKEFDEDADPVRLGTLGWRERYYKAKFGVEMNDTAFFDKLTTIYAEGLQWVLQYYYQGCASWDWYYPFHYPPFISDVSQLESKRIHFSTDTKPFAPFEQLLAVLPADSSQFLPPAYAELMCDPLSPIYDFFPIDFEEDANGKPFAWQAIALLPFIDEKRLKHTIQDRNLDKTFTEEEKERNKIGDTYIFCSRSNPLAASIIDLDNYNPDKKLEIDSTSTPFFGYVSHPKFASYHSRFFASPINGLPDLTKHDGVFSCFYNPEKIGEFVSKLRPGLIMPPPVLSIHDVNRQKLYYSATEQQRPLRSSNDSYYQSNRPSHSMPSSHMASSHVPSYQSRGSNQESYFRRDNNQYGNQQQPQQNSYQNQESSYQQNNYASQQNYNNNNRSNYNNNNNNNSYDNNNKNSYNNNPNNRSNYQSSIEKNYNNNNNNRNDSANVDIAQLLRSRLENNTTNHTNIINTLLSPPLPFNNMMPINSLLPNTNSLLSNNSLLNNYSGSLNNNNIDNNSTNIDIAQQLRSRLENNNTSSNYNNNNNSQQRGGYSNNYNNNNNNNRTQNYNNNNNNYNNRPNNNNNNGRYQSTTGNF